MDLEKRGLFFTTPLEIRSVHSPLKSCGALKWGFFEYQPNREEMGSYLEERSSPPVNHIEKCWWSPH